MRDETVTEFAAKAGGMVSQRGADRGRGLVTQTCDQRVKAHGAVCIERSLASTARRRRATERQHALAVAHLERPQDANSMARIVYEVDAARRRRTRLSAVSRRTR